MKNYLHAAAALELIALMRMVRANKRPPHHRTGTPSLRKRPYNAAPGKGRDINSSGYLSPAHSTSITKLQRAARKGQIKLMGA